MPFLIPITLTTRMVSNILAQKAVEYETMATIFPSGDLPERRNLGTRHLAMVSTSLHS